MKFYPIIIGILSSAISTVTYSDDIITKIPTEPDTSAKYIFYLHGSVEEHEGSTEKYEAAIEAISDSDATVISEVRDETDPNSYAKVLKSNVTTLLDKGVPANNITISGFSKGSIITLAAAGTINNPNINYVLLAGCSTLLNNKYNINTAISKGRILSIFDSSDEKFGTCEDIINSSDSLTFEEIELDSGKGHKLFRIPKDKFIEQWRDPLIDWEDA